MMYKLETIVVVLLISTMYYSYYNLLSVLLPPKQIHNAIHHKNLVHKSKRPPLNLQFLSISSIPHFSSLFSNNAATPSQGYIWHVFSEPIGPHVVSCFATIQKFLRHSIYLYPSHAKQQDKLSQLNQAPWQYNSPPPSTMCTTYKLSRPAFFPSPPLVPRHSCARQRLSKQTCLCPASAPP